MKKKRVLKSWSKRNVPEEIWPEILSRLPVKTLLRFRCVSKTWRSFIDDPDFTRLHLNRFKNNCDEAHLFIHSYAGRWIVRCSKTLRTASRLSSPENHVQRRIITLPSTSVPQKLRWHLICSVDGLFMLRGILRGKSELWLWNPSIRKSRLLPSFPIDFSMDTDYYDMGMGYDPSINDYKYVLLSFHLHHLSAIGVYTCGSHSWKILPFHAKDPLYWWSFHPFLDVVCFKSCLYRTAIVGDSERKELASFDLTTEEFSITKLPESISRHPRHAKLLIYGGCSLAAFLYGNSSISSSLWVLHTSDPGAEKGFTCWIKLHTFHAGFIPSCLYMKKNGELLHLQPQVPRRVISHNPENKEVKILLRRTRFMDMHMVCAYKESLIQP